MKYRLQRFWYPLPEGKKLAGTQLWPIPELRQPPDATLGYLDLLVRAGLTPEQSESDDDDDEVIIDED
jgi:ubiquinone biosynthesis protein Coq4